jgi:hypothetical protein
MAFVLNKGVDMFKDYKEAGWDCHLIIDDDFEEKGVDLEKGLLGVVIACYTKRGLPLAPNLFRCMLLVRERCSYWTLDKQVEWNKQNNPRWHEIEKDMQMYLVFS